MSLSIALLQNAMQSILILKFHGSLDGLVYAFYATFHYRFAQLLDKSVPQEVQNPNFKTAIYKFKQATTASTRKSIVTRNTKHDSHLTNYNEKKK